MANRVPVYLLGSRRLKGCKYGFSATMDGVYECLNDARRFCVDYELLDIIPEGTLRDESEIKRRGRKSGFHLGREQFAWVQEIEQIFKDYKMELGQQGDLFCGCTTIVEIQETTVSLAVIEPALVLPVEAEEPKLSHVKASYFVYELTDGHKLRVTPDEKVAGIDYVGSTGQKNPHEVYSRIVKEYPELLTKCEKFRFPGRGQRWIDVYDLEGLTYLAAKLPGKEGQAVLEDLVQTKFRVLRGDVSLTLEMVDKIDNPIDAKRVSVRAENKKANLLARDRIAACGGRGDQRPNVFAAVNGNHNRYLLGRTATEIQQAGGVRSTRDNPAVTETHLALLSLADAMLADKLASTPVYGNKPIIALDKRQVCEPLQKFRRDNGIADVAV